MALYFTGTTLPYPSALIACWRLAGITKTKKIHNFPKNNQTTPYLILFLFFSYNVLFFYAFFNINIVNISNQ